MRVDIGVGLIVKFKSKHILTIPGTHDTCQQSSAHCLCNHRFHVNSIYDLASALNQKTPKFHTAPAQIVESKQEFMNGLTNPI